MQQSVVFFDGVCNLCNGAVQFIIRHDKRNTFKFAALQSDEGIKLLKEVGYQSVAPDTILLLHKGKLYSRSTAALKIARELNGLWPMLYASMVIPKFIRDAAYNLIARNRYKIWGKQDSCWIPTPELKAKFL